MHFIDDIVVKAAKTLIAGFMALGTGLVYIQFCALILAVVVMVSAALVLLLP